MAVLTGQGTQPRRLPTNRAAERLPIVTLVNNTYEICMLRTKSSSTQCRQRTLSASTNENIFGLTTVRPQGDSIQITIPPPRTTQNWISATRDPADQHHFPILARPPPPWMGTSFTYPFPQSPFPNSTQTGARKRSQKRSPFLWKMSSWALPSRKGLTSFRSRGVRPGHLRSREYPHAGGGLKELIGILVYCLLLQASNSSDASLLPMALPPRTVGSIRKCRCMRARQSNDVARYANARRECLRLEPIRSQRCLAETKLSAVSPLASVSGGLLPLGSSLFRNNFDLE